MSEFHDENGKFKVGHEKIPGCGARTGAAWAARRKPVIDWCRNWTRMQAREYLEPLATGKNKDGTPVKIKPAEQLEAIKLIMAYGIGKPIATELQGQLENFSEVNDDDLEELARELLKGGNAGAVGGVVGNVTAQVAGEVSELPAQSGASPVH